MQRQFEPRRIRIEETLADGFDEHATCLAIADCDPTAVNRTLNRITKRGPTQIFNRFARDKPHFSKPRCDPINPVNSDNLASLARPQLVESGQCLVSVIENQSQ